MTYFKCVLILLIFLAYTSVCGADEVRIVSLAPSITEMLFAIGMGDNIVGVDDYSNYPEETEKIEKVGTFFRPDMEKIILLKPDYVFAHRDMPDDKGDYLKGLGVKVIGMDPKNIEEICDSIEYLGEVFGRKKKASYIANDIRNRISLIRKSAKTERPKVFIQLFDDPLITSSTFLGDVIEAAGGENVAWDVKRDTGIFSYELLIRRNPDIVLIAGFSDEENLPDSINAVKTGRVYRDLDMDMLLRPGPRVIEAIEKMNRVFYAKD